MENDGIHWISFGLGRQSINLSEPYIIGENFEEPA